MADTRFFQKNPAMSLGEIAKITDCTLADPTMASRMVEDVAELGSATEKDISWANNPKYRDVLKATKAGAVIVPEKFKEFVAPGVAVLVSGDAHRSYGLLTSAFYPRRVSGVISDKAVIDSSARLGADCEVAPGAVIGANVKLGARCKIGANAVIEQGVEMGDECTVGAGATISHCIAGHKVYIYPGAHIGQDGFGFAMSPKFGPTKVQQLGRVMIGNDVEIGSGTTVDRGAVHDTVIGDGTRIDNQVMVAHNVKLGRCCVLVSQVGIAGSCELGDFVVCAGQVGIAGHLKIGTGATLGAKSGVMTDVPAGAKMMGAPCVPAADFMRQVLFIQKGSSKKAPEGKPLGMMEKCKLYFAKKKLEKQAEAKPQINQQPEEKKGV